jgi:hypothetical protein
MSARLSRIADRECPIVKVKFRCHINRLMVTRWPSRWSAS